MEHIQFGYHLRLDFYGCDVEALSSMDKCYEALDKLPTVLSMHKLIPPYVISADSNENRGGKDPGGYTGFVVIAESHISLHTFAKRGFVSIDVYSCNEFDKQAATDFLSNIFQPKDIEENFVKRGTRYPVNNIY